MRSAGLQLLLVEDSPFDARLIAEQLRAAAPGPYQLRHVELLESAREELAREEPDCVLLDLGLPDATRLQAVETLLASHPEVPLVVLSAADESVGPLAVQAGAQDYLTKGETDGRQLWRAVRYARERKKAELLLRHQALHDALTGLPNRGLFMDRLGVALARLTRRPGQVAVMFLDLDGFKWVNDSLGHDAGDVVVAEVARRLRGVLRPYDTAARIGGDEFLVLVEGPDDDVAAVTRLADRVQEHLLGPIVVDDTQVRVSASIGITCTTDGTTSTTTLIRDADAAMYRAKALGKNRWALFDASMREAAERRVGLLNRLHRALERREVTVLYQPIASIPDGEIRGWEALLRCCHDDGELVAAPELLGVLEDHGLVVPVGQLVLETSLRWLADHCRSLPVDQPPPYMSVNVSALQLTQADVVPAIDDLVRACGLRHDQVHLELSDSELIQQDGMVRQRLDQLKGLGLQLVMDDYGIGRSTLVHLKELPFDALKIDRSFIASLPDSEADRSLVGAVVALGRSLGLDVVASGVDSKEQAAALQEMGCELGQGELYGEALLSGSCAG